MKMLMNVISIEQGVARKPEWRMARPVDFTLCPGEQIAIIGPNGGGKTMLINMINGAHPLLGDGVRYDFGSYTGTGRLVSDNIRTITFRDMYGGDNDRTYYLQQRWNQAEIDEQMPTVRSIIENEMRITRCSDMPDSLIDMFAFRPLLDKHVIFLSSGEMRKLRLIRALMTAPRVLIIDNPFIGLDKQTRQQLTDLFTLMTQGSSPLQLILVVSKVADIPPFITHTIEVSNMIVGPKVPYKPVGADSCRVRESDINRARHKPISADVLAPVNSLPAKTTTYNADKVISMHGLTIRYGERTIIDSLDWTVMNGERWALGGPNGSGKSTLLSLVCADNPQGYACDITLFDRRRGSGESIWDIKKHIGYVSPELHRSYHRDIPAIKIVASGLKDSVGLYVRPDETEYDICRRWMKVFTLEGKEQTSFLHLSGGEQRLVLLARAFVKDPELLILDEPLHGLDDDNCLLVKAVINAFCQRPGKTLVMVSHYDENLPSCIDHHLTLSSKLLVHNS